MVTPYYITNNTAVDSRFARKLADGEQVQLMAAPEIGADGLSAIIYMSTNGDPVYVATIGEGSFYHLTDEQGWTEEEGDVPNWLLSLREFGFDAEIEDDWSGAGAEAVEFILELMAAAGME